MADLYQSVSLVCPLQWRQHWLGHCACYGRRVRLRRPNSTPHTQRDAHIQVAEHSDAYNIQHSTNKKVSIADSTASRQFQFQFHYLFISHVHLFYSVYSKIAQ